MSDLRIAAQQALDAIESDTMLFSAWTGKMIAARTALRTALAQQAEPRNQCGETCERAKLCAVCARGLAEPVEPAAWECKDGGLKALTQRQYDAQPPNIRRHYTRIAPPQRLPLSEREILEAVSWERAEMWMKLAPNFPVDEARKETIKNARAVEKASWKKNHG